MFTPHLHWKQPHSLNHEWFQSYVVFRNYFHHLPRQRTILINKPTSLPIPLPKYNPQNPPPSLQRIPSSPMRTNSSLILTPQIRPHKTRTERKNPHTTTLQSLMHLNSNHIQRRLTCAILIPRRSINLTAGISCQFHRAQTTGDVNQIWVF